MIDALPVLTEYFNSRPSARGDAFLRLPQALQGFQFTPLREGRPARFRPCSSRRTYFNSRPSARGDLRVQGATMAVGKFQFTPLREGRQEIES